MEKKASLLVVDDDSRMCRMLARILKREGYEITTAGSGEHMLELMETDRFDLMILDRMLPDAAGW